MKKTISGLVLCAAILAVSAPAFAQIKDPNLVAQKLYKAWQIKSRKSARKVADKTGVNKLFGVRWRPMTFEGCKVLDQGGYECIYRDKKTDLSLAMIVDGGVSAGGYTVVSLSFSSEE